MKSESVFDRLETEVVKPGLCSHCGTCAGISNGVIKMFDTKYGPNPKLFDNAKQLEEDVYYACPGKGLNYPELNNYVFGKLPDNWLVGNYKSFNIGFSLNEEIRRQGASGGIITQCLIFLLKNKLIDGAITLMSGKPKPYLAEPIIATTESEILRCSQSVYAPIPVNTILENVTNFKGKLAYVGLPDQVAAIRHLQKNNNQAANKIKYIIGPYVGINMYIDAIESFIRANGVKSLDEIKELKFRDGEWPGYLKIKTKKGKILKAVKFYYNYLLPFYITKNSLVSTDFTNELTDISVGDAWSPKYEKEGKGFSVVVSRTENGHKLLDEMSQKAIIDLKKIALDEALSMHGHMIDFKKRGAFIRINWRKKLGKKIPEYGYFPESISLSRKIIEFVISSVFYLCHFAIAKWLVRQIPISIVGRLFNIMRKSWKNVSKPTKRKGLYSQKYLVRH